MRQQDHTSPVWPPGAHARSTPSLCLWGEHAGRASRPQKLGWTGWTRTVGTTMRGDCNMRGTRAHRCLEPHSPCPGTPFTDSSFAVLKSLKNRFLIFDVLRPPNLIIGAYSVRAKMLVSPHFGICFVLLIPPFIGPPHFVNTNFGTVLVVDL